MEHVTLPTKIEYQPGEKNAGTIIIEPCFPGYGTTWGNALRRVLLSSLPGAAVTAVKIKGVRHEFSAIPYIKEDTLEIILNLKLLRLKIFTDKPAEMSLHVKGEKKVKASDIKASSEVEIVNPDLEIATLTDKKAELDMTIWVSSGYGYEPVEEKDKKELETGTIAVDSLFTPIKKVSLNIENVRVGKKTNYDRLILSIETDGTITPYQAFLEASQMLAQHFAFLTEKIGEQKEEKKEGKKEKKVKAKKIKKTTKKAVKKTIRKTATTKRSTK